MIAGSHGHLRLGGTIRLSRRAIVATIGASRSNHRSPSTVHYIGWRWPRYSILTTSSLEAAIGHKSLHGHRWDPASRIALARQSGGRNAARHAPHRPRHPSGGNGSRLGDGDNLRSACANSSNIRGSGNRSFTWRQSTRAASPGSALGSKRPSLRKRHAISGTAEGSESLTSAKDK